MADPEKKAALFDQLARVGKALGNGKRLELLDLLAQSERSVESLTAACGLGLTTVSAHLQTLKAAGLVTTRREGQKIHYSLAGDDVLALYRLARDTAAARIADVERVAADYLGDTPGQISRDELLAGIGAGRYTVLDVRPVEEYDAAHLPGALSIPIDELSARLDEIPADTQIVAYCRGPYCVFAHDAVELLTRSGRSAFRLEDGLPEWHAAGLPITSAGRA
ncbi:ArsR/SmtB family transcription factor [Glycomyces albidus]|uniref:Metalloregulator ArsR/SmtB family transcription factor n=1 Tax=Glycomyces albidus TaxID=2656774 RepID=A0A6L5GBC7_9ACTN|nr:metalloregulator ArsR/SmtB family transcription factor [Glycomyces albidus]